MKSYLCRSRFQESPFIFFDTNFIDDIEKLKEHLTVVPIYQKVLYDKYRKLVYRFFLKEQTLFDTSGVMKNIFDKDVILMVLNEKFKIIDEVNLGSKYLWFYSFVTNKGLYIRRYIEESDIINKSSNNEVFTIFSWN